MGLARRTTSGPPGTLGRLTRPLQILRAAMLLTLAGPASSAAQPPPARPALPRVDVAAAAGWVGGNADLPDDVYRTWDSAGVGSLIVGVYWTEHLKTELDVNFSGDRDFYGSRTLTSGRNVSQYQYQSHRVRSRSVSLTPTWQYLHNTWVHPFLGAGLDIDWTRHRTETEVRTSISTPPTSTFTIDHLPDEIDRRVRVRASIAAGAKLYVSRRAFARTDVRLAVAGGAKALRWRVGAGFDF
jgi:hypothetical protein